MNTTEHILITLTPEEGMWLTDGTTVTPNPVYLGANDDPARWSEIPAEEGQTIKAAQDAAVAAEMDRVLREAGINPEDISGNKK